MSSIGDSIRDALDGVGYSLGDLGDTISNAFDFSSNLDINGNLAVIILGAIIIIPLLFISDALSERIKKRRGVPGDDEPRRHVDGVERPAVEAPPAEDWIDGALTSAAQALRPIAARALDVVDGLAGTTEPGAETRALESAPHDDPLGRRMPRTIADLPLGDSAQADQLRGTLAQLVTYADEYATLCPTATGQTLASAAVPVPPGGHGAQVAVALRAIVTRTVQLFDRLAVKGSDQQVRLAVVSFTDILGKVAQVASPHYLGDMLTHPELWNRPAERVAAVQAALTDVEAQLVANIRQVNEATELDFTVALATLAAAAPDNALERLYATDGT